MGYTSSIQSVVLNADSTHTIVLRVEHNGNNEPGWKALNHYSVEADIGTYSNVYYTLIYGNVTYNGINMGPNLGGWDKDGFRIASINGIGAGAAGIFTITYTLAGGLQDQWTMAKAGGNSLEVFFTADEFLAVLECNVSISPYYAMPEGGKIEPINKIGPELTALYQYLGIPFSDDIYQIVYDEVSTLYLVMVEIFPVSGQYATLLSLLETNYGLTVVIPDPDGLVITGQVPIQELDNLNYLMELLYASPLYPATTNIGLVTSQGDTSMVSNISREIFSVNSTGKAINGSGIKIGVLSDSYNTQPNNPANDDIRKLDLPGVGIDENGVLYPNPNNSIPVDSIRDYPYGQASDEGRAMLQIIHDIAPGAELAFRTGVLGAVDMADGIQELETAGCDIIVDDITYVTEPFFQDGIVSQAVNAVVANGITYFTSAGNFGNKSYQSQFTASSITAPGISGVTHNFATIGTPDIYQEVSAVEPGNYMIVLQWDDGSGFDATTTDLDIYLSNANGSGLIGYNKVNTGGHPIEVLPFIVSEATQTNIMVVNSSGSIIPVEFKYIVFQGQLSIDEYNTGSSTVVGHANAAGAITVGAVRYDYTPAYGVDPPVIMSYSSVGGMLVNNTDRQKPDISAPNGVNTGVELGGVNIEGDLFPNFFGTSAAAPHAAAVAALLQEAKEKYYGAGQSLLPSEIRGKMQGTAIDMYASGYDASSGYGFIQADEALLTLANSAPLISGLSYGPSDSIPGLNEVLVSVTGNYYSPGSKIYFNGVPLETEQYDAHTLQATVPPFTDLYPPLQTWNPPKTDEYGFVLTNGEDGGLSNPLYFSEKPTIVGTITNKTKSYGADVTGLEVSYMVQYLDGTLGILDTILTPEEQARVESIIIETNATPLANAGLWPIVASLDDPLNPLSTVVATAPLDTFLLYNYNFSFNNGLLDITKLNLTVTPDSASFVYNTEISGFTFDFSFEETGISQINADTIKAQLEKAYMTDLLGDATALVNGRATALVNADSLDILNTSYMVSKYALENRVATALVNGQAMNLATATALVNATTLTNRVATALVNGQATALVNAEPLVNGQATALVNGIATALVNGRATALVNGKATALVNGIATALVNGQATALVNSGSFSTVNNHEAIIFLDPLEVDTLLATFPQQIPPSENELTSISLITGNTVGDHYIAPGTFIASNFNVYYGLGILTITPATAAITLEFPELTYDGAPKLVTAITDPENLIVTVTYNGSETPPANSGDYTVVATVVDQNYIGTQTEFMTISKADLTVTADDQSKVYGTTDPALNYDLTSGMLYGLDAFSGVLARNGGENIGDYPILQGSLTAGNNYQIMYNEGTLTISPALLTVAANPQQKTYGTPDPYLNYQFTPNPLVGTDAFTGSLERTTGENAGTYLISQGTLTAGSNYSVSFTGALLTIDPVSLTVTADPQDKIYGTSDPDLSYQFTPNPLVGTDALTGSLERATGENVGTYLISQGTLTAGDNYTIAYEDELLTIDPALVSYAVTNNVKPYTGLIQGVNITTVPASLSYAVAYTLNGVVADPVDAGVYIYSITNQDGNYTGSAIGDFTIDHVNVIVTGDHQVINEGSPPPSFSFTYEWFVNNEQEGAVFPSGVGYTTGYNGDAGIYPVIFPASSTNYTFSLQDDINLYVNPDGPGTKSVKPRLICVEELPVGSTWPYIAWFDYDNKNNDHVFVPFGENNKVVIEGGGLFQPITPQPELFFTNNSGSQVDWGVYFDGNKITWTVTSQHHGHPSSTGSNASSTSNKCNSSSGAEIAGDPSAEEPGIWAYPNPVTDKVTIGLDDKPLSGEVVILNMKGGMQTLKTTWMLKSNTTEIDFSSMASGMYIIKIETSNSVEIVRVLKK